MIGLSAEPALRVRSAVEEIFAKATRFQPLAMGLSYFMSTAFRPDGTSDFMKWAVEIAQGTMQAGVDMAS